MYTLDAVDSFQITDPADSYIYDVVPVAGGLAIISSDDILRLLDPLNLSGPPLNSVRRVNTDVTCLKSLGEIGDAQSIVATSGRDGKVNLVDLRSAGGGRVGSVSSGELEGFFYIPRERALNFLLRVLWGPRLSLTLLLVTNLRDSSTPR
jgi:SEL1 protein